MARFILTSVAMAFAALLTVGSTAEARPDRGGSSSHQVRAHNYRNHSNNHDYHRYTHRGRDYRGWHSHCWFPRYRCYGYYCATERCWFYWCTSLNCYLPVSYFSAYPPTTVGIAPTAPFAAPGMMPVGATAVPANLPVGLPGGEPVAIP